MSARNDGRNTTVHTLHDVETDKSSAVADTRRSESVIERAARILGGGFLGRIHVVHPVLYAEAEEGSNALASPIEHIDLGRFSEFAVY